MVSMIRKLFLIVLIVGFAGSGYLYSRRVLILEYLRNINREQIPIAVGFEEASKPAVPVPETAKNIIYEDKPVPAPPAVKKELPAVALPQEINLDVPFSSQAPHANWEQPYQDACEEASIAMVHYFFVKKRFNPETADKEILDLVAFEERRFGYGYDITAEETVNTVKGFYGYKNVEIIQNPTVDTIKSVLAKGLPVVAPVYGRALKNPYFTPPGPTYHMLVIKGYTRDKFITNDPGTKRGGDYLYSYSVMMDAIHDWNGGDVQNGRKAIIIIHPEK